MKKIVISSLVFCSFIISSSHIFANDVSIEAGKIRAVLCIGCHGLHGEGKVAINGQQAFPRLSGQIKGYFIKSVNDYKTDKRNDPMMSAIAKGLSDTDIENLASYFLSIK